MKLDNNHLAFYALVKAGLWEQDVLLSQYGQIDFNEIYRLAEEQTVVGLVVAGLEHVSDIIVPQAILLNFVGNALQIERRNVSMNSFINKLMGWIQNAGIFTILVKGQGVAQCYERPLWRSSGDIDLMFAGADYENAKKRLITFASSCDKEDVYKKHLAMSIDSWEVELHGTFRGRMWHRLDLVLDDLQNDCLKNGSVRLWKNGTTEVPLPSPNNDSFFIFAHVLQHFFMGGIGIRQICDWCRLLWTYHDEIDIELLECRLNEARALPEWKAFAALAVDYLGMPTYAMPLYDSSKIWSKKANKILNFINDLGNFGHNRDLSYQKKQFYLFRKINTFRLLSGDIFRHLSVFPKHSLIAWGNMFHSRIKYVFE